MTCELLRGSRQLQQCQARHDERSASNAPDRRRLTENHDTDEHSADGTDADPHGRGRAERNGFITIDNSRTLADIVSIVMAVNEPVNDP
jgi:hypothetical protein